MDQFLEITDGNIGLERFCDKTGPVQLVANLGMRDLYVTFKNLRTAYPAELECFISCGEKGIGTKNRLEITNKIKGTDLTLRITLKYYFRRGSQRNC